MGAATAFGVTHERHPVDAHTVLCSQSASLKSDGAGITVAQGSASAAVAACSDRWAQLWPDTAKPAAFAICVYPATPGNTGGGQVVFPAKPGLDNDQTCRAVGADLLSSK